MNRNITNKIRFILDEILPPIIRDSKYFITPFFYLLYGKKNYKNALEIKSNIFLKPNELEYWYSKSINIIKRDRASDLTKASIQYIKSVLDKNSNSILDVGCGSGYFLNQLLDTNLKLTGCDQNKGIDYENIDFVKADILKLPFEDYQFDIVTCFHTLEHIPDLPNAIKELKRIAKNQLIIIVPKQREFYYTFDSHIHFFPYKEKLIYYFGIENYECLNIEGDWVYTANLR